MDDLVPILLSIAETSDSSLMWPFIKTIVATIIIIVLAFVFIRFILPKLYSKNSIFTKGSSRVANLEVVERLGLEPRKALYLIRTGKKYSVLGSTDQGIALITQLDPADLHLSREQEGSEE